MNKSILLVDDVLSYRAVVAQRLRLEKFNVKECTTAFETLSSIIIKRPDLVIIDSQLSDSSGSSLAKKIKNTGLNIQCILIVQPVTTIDSPLEFCKQNGIAKLYYGPLHPHILVNKVKNFSKNSLQMLPTLDAPFLETLFPPNQSKVDPVADATTNKHLFEIRRSYQKKIPKEISLLKKYIDRAYNDPGDDDAFAGIYNLTHALHGTAGTLNFFKISDLARNIYVKTKKIQSLKTQTQRYILWQKIFDALNNIQQIPERSSLIPQTPISATGIATLLIIDSKGNAAQQIKEIGQENFVTILTAHNYQQALLKASVSHLDGVIIDLDMDTEEQPFEIAYKLRNIKDKKDLSIAFMSQNESIPNRIAAADAGATQFLKKPVEKEELLEIARTFASISKKTTPKILLVDDDEFFRSHIASILKSEHMTVCELQDPRNVLSKMEQFEPDLILLDVQMPELSGWNVCRMIRATPLWKNIPILFLTAETTQDSRIACFEAGGDDYIQKPCIKKELLARINLRLERIRLFNERANNDPLTGLLNRRAFLEQFKIKLANCKRYKHKLSFCILDLDNFKHVNDTFGHLAGDKVLSALGKLLSSRFRAVDIKGRWGGEEFSIVFYNEDAITARMILNRVLISFRETTFKGDNNEEFKVTFSAGIETLYPLADDSFDTMFKQADKNLYFAKKNGRNTIVI